MKEFDVMVLGGGAAGLMCAITAGNRGRQAVVLEGSNKTGKKILMSGGGRCNFTNLYCEPSRFLSGNDHFCRSALSRYTQWDFIALVEKHGIAYHEKTDGQLFCDVSSKDILRMLHDESDRAGVTIQTDCVIEKVSCDSSYVVHSNGDDYSAPSLVIATGGLSIPKMGASGIGYDIARQFGLRVFETRAGLVPMTLSGAIHELSARLSGVSVHATVETGDSAFTDDILFTHRGLSGPAILQLSNFWKVGHDIVLDLLPKHGGAELLVAARRDKPRAVLRTVLSELLPRKLVLELQEWWWQDIAETALAEISNARLEDVAKRLHHWVLRPSGTEGYRTAEVTLGGIDTDELSSKTMECKRQPGLYCIGEVVDVTGQLGGFNFQWAWASGHAAGQFV